MSKKHWGTRPGLILDAGALIELQKWKSPLLSQVESAVESDKAILTPAAAFCEWLVGAPTGRQAAVRKLVRVIDVDDSLALAASQGLQGVAHPSCKTCSVRGGPSVVDALVMALAETQGDTVITGDFHDLSALNGHFRRVTVQRIP